MSKDQHLPGFAPSAYVQLSVFLDPDGQPSHYEICGRTPSGSLTAFEARASHGDWDDDPETQVAVQRWLEITRSSSRALAEAEATRVERERQAGSG